MNVRLEIEYDGTDFAGWQRQPHKPTVQALIEDTIEKIVGRRTVVYGASRTDSGVSAEGQVAHFFVDDSSYSPETWLKILNHHLPGVVRIRGAREVPLTFHSQKHAVSKVYEYRVLNRYVASALDRRVLFYPQPCDWERVRRAMPHFLGRHDFKAFQAAKSTVRTTRRDILSFTLHEDAPKLYRFRIEGTGFLKQMVRTMVGTLLQIGEGKRDPDCIPAILESRDRRKAGHTVAAHGLCLVEIRYGRNQ